MFLKIQIKLSTQWRN